MRSTGALVLVGAAAVLWPSVGFAQANPEQPAAAAPAAAPAPAAAAPAAASPAAPAEPASAGDALGAPPNLEQGRTVEVTAATAATAPTQDTYSNYEPPAHSNAGRVSGFMGWAFSVPLGSVRDFAAVVSPLGFEIMIDSWVTENLSIAAGGEWITYVDDRPRTTNTVGNAAITATAYNYMQTATARAALHYYFLDDNESVAPYIGPHIGINWTTFDSETADLVLTDNRVSFAFGAEGGVKIPFGRNAPVAIANLRYSANLQAEFLNKVTNVQALSLMLGLGF